MKTKHLQDGYSLIELLIYIALFAVISVVLVHSLVTCMRTYSSAQGYRHLQSNGELVMERISREVRAADTIVSGTFGTHPGALALSGDDGSVTFSVVNSAVQINDDGVTGALTTGQVTVTDLIFRRIITPVGEGVKVELTLTTTSGVIRSTSFYSTVLLRNQAD